MAKGYHEGSKFDDLWSDKVVILPGDGAILEGEIEKALDGNSFFWFEKLEEKHIKVDGIDSSTFSSALNIFTRFERFGLPHGKGYLNELPWIVDFLQLMVGLRKSIEDDLTEEAINKASPKK